MATLTRETEIRKIVWQKPGNPFAIVKTTDREFESWKGPIGEDIAPGTWLRAEGYAGPREGRWPAPFVVTKVLQIEGVRANVGKAWMEWRLPEIGEVRAERLSEQFGRGLPDLFDNTSEARRVLLSISGLTPARVDKIQDAYRDHEDELRTALWLSEPDPENVPDAGMPWPAVKVVLEEYSRLGRSYDTLREDVTADPYELMAFDGITFKTADSLAEGLGLEERDPRRLRGMVWEKLEDLAGASGECVLPRSGLMQKMAQFRYSETELEEIFRNSPHFQLNAFGAQLSRLLRAEADVAETVLHMLARDTKQQEMTLDLPDWLDPSQRSAVESLMNVPLAILTGGPGTGKTTVLKTALEQMEKRGERIVLASPTGKAAKRMTETTGRPAKTVHKLLEWKPDGFDRDATNPIDADVVVVDESSMLDIELAASLFRALGGARLILVGDVDQLPPVGPGQPLLDLMKSGLSPTFRLMKTHRQTADSWVIDNASKILKGQTPSLVDQSDFRFYAAKESERIIEMAITLYKSARNAGPDVEKQLQVLTPEHKKGAGTMALNHEIQKALNPNASDSRFAEDHVQGAGESKIFVSDKVLYIKNNPELGLVNGSMGKVVGVAITGEHRMALVKFEGDVNPKLGELTALLPLFKLSEDEIEALTHNEEFANYFVLQDEFLRPLQLAYAMTVHKAQGSEWKNVVVIADEAHWSMRRKLLYTAVTRTSKNLTILGTEAAVARGAKNNPDENRATLLQERLHEKL